jgi:O-antigen ligase
MKQLSSLSIGEILSWFGILIILALAPLSFSYFYPVSLDLCKIVIFKIGVFWLLLGVSLLFGKFRLRLSRSDLVKFWPLALLFVFLGISLPFSTDMATSWFGSYSRQSGLISWIFYGLWAVLLYLFLAGQEKKCRQFRIRRLLAIGSLTGLVVSLYALCQLIGWDLVSWSEPPYLTGRAVSFFGQPAYLACWLVIILPLTAYLAVTAKNKRGKIIWCLIFMSELAGLLATGSRSVFLIFLAVSLFFLISQSYKVRNLSKCRFWGGIMAIICLAGLFFSFLALKNFSRFQESFNWHSGSLFAREQLYTSGWQAFMKKPWFGYGLENQTEAYFKAYKIDWAIYSNPNTYSDRAHNFVLDTLLTGGVFGLIAVTIFLFWIGRNLWQARRQEPEEKLSLFLAWSLISYLLVLLFNFSVTVTNIYFWLLVSLSLVLAYPSAICWSRRSEKPGLLTFTFVLAAAVLLIYGTFSETNKIVADYYYNQSLTAAGQGDYFKALVLKDYFDENYHDQVANFYYNSGLSLHLLEDLPAINDRTVSFALVSYLKSFSNRLPNDSFEYRFVKSFILGMTGNLSKSVVSFSDLANQSPELPKIRLAWGDVLFYNHDYAGAVAQFSAASRLLPDSNNPRLNIIQKKHLDDYRAAVNDRWQRAKALIK